jgi:hypothetical protein
MIPLEERAQWVSQEFGKMKMPELAVEAQRLVPKDEVNITKHTSDRVRSPSVSRNVGELGFIAIGSWVEE